MDANKRDDHYYEDQKKNEQKKNEQKTDGMKRMSSARVKTEQEKIVEKMKKVLNFLENVEITNEESLVHVSKPLDNLLSSLKYLTMEPFFTKLPMEIKTDILSYLCDAGAFVAASVCQEWSVILNKRLTELKKVNIGKCCTNQYSCENNVCFMPEEMLKASINLKLNIPLVICYPVTNVDSKLLSKGLASVSDFTITDLCDCTDEFFEHVPILTEDQAGDLFEILEKDSEIESKARSVQLSGVDITNMDQNRLANDLLKINHLSLDRGRNWNNGLDLKMLIEKLLQVPIKFKLSHLYLGHITYPAESAVDLANALCRIKSVRLGPDFPLGPVATERIIQNILHHRLVFDGKDWQAHSRMIQALVIRRDIKWRSVITPEDLKTLINKMGKLEVEGIFSLEQIQATRSIPGVQVIDNGPLSFYFKILKV